MFMLPAAVTSVAMPLESTVGLKCARTNQFALRLLNLSACSAGRPGYAPDLWGAPFPIALHMRLSHLRGLCQVNSLLKAARNGCNLKQQAEVEKGEERGEDFTQFA